MNVLNKLFYKKYQLHKDDETSNNYEIKHSIKQKAIVFIDFEHWYYSSIRLHKTRPDPLEWRLEIEQKYDIQKIMAFADFTESAIKTEIQTLRHITNLIIETQNSNIYSKKDMTDFIMLDAIYQSVEDQDSPDVYIIFTGDGHFQSVVKYLINIRKKKVIVYGVKQATNKQLAAVASECIQIPRDNEFTKKHTDMILDDLYKLSDSQRGLSYPTFLKTVEIVSSRHRTSPEKIKSALSDLVSKGYIVSKIVKPSLNIKFKALFVNWDGIFADGIWDSSNSDKLL